MIARYTSGMQTLRAHYWSIIASLFFISLVVFGLDYLHATGNTPQTLSLPDFIILSLAVWRLTRLFTYDSITKFIRDWFEGAQPGTLRGTLHTLMNCLWCTGLWFGATVVFFYFAFPFLWIVFLMLAVSAVGSFLQVISNWVGWSAEYKKRQVLGQENSKSTCG